MFQIWGNKIKIIRITSKNEVYLYDYCIEHLKNYYFDTIDVSELNMYYKSNLYEALCYASSHLIVKDECYVFEFANNSKPYVYKNESLSHNQYYIYDWDKSEYVDVTQEEFEKEKDEWLIKMRK